jgi:hypothetical protein
MELESAYQRRAFLWLASPVLLNGKGPEKWPDDPSRAMQLESQLSMGGGAAYPSDAERRQRDALRALCARRARAEAGRRPSGAEGGRGSHRRRSRSGGRPGPAVKAGGVVRERARAGALSRAPAGSVLTWIYQEKRGTWRWRQSHTPKKRRHRHPGAFEARDNEAGKARLRHRD